MSKIVERVLDLLELFGEERRPLSLSDIARLLNVPLSSCHDVLQAMQARGYLYEVAPRAGYYPTLRLQALGKVISENDPVVARADVLLRSLHATLDETVLLAKVQGLQATYLLAFEAPHPLRFVVKVGNAIPNLHATSGGKALLGSMDDRDLSMTLKSLKLAPLTDRTIISVESLRLDVEFGRTRLWFISQGENIEGITTLSSCFRWNTAVYIVTVAGPSARLDHRLDQASRLLTNVCQMLEMPARASGPGDIHAHRAASHMTVTAGNRRFPSREPDAMKRKRLIDHPNDAPGRMNGPSGCLR